jgi:hypothetical protein
VGEPNDLTAKEAAKAKARSKEKRPPSIPLGPPPRRGDRDEVILTDNNINVGENQLRFH